MDVPAPPADPWRLLVESAPEACAVFDRQLRHIAWNESWVRSFRPAHTDLSGLSIYEAFPEVPDRWRANNQRCLAGETLVSKCDSFERQDGRIDHVRYKLSPWRDAAGAVGGMIVHSQLINDVVEAQRRVEEQTQFQQALFENSPIGLNLCRLDGTWLESNPAFLKIIGYGKEEADGKLTYWELTPREYDDREAEQLRSLTENGHYGPYEKEFIRKDGSRVPVRLSGFLIERDGGQYIWSLIEDITRRKALEAEFEQERLKTIQASKLALLGEMAAGIAHELNNPLSIIDGYVQLLQHSADPDRLLPDALEAMADATDRSARIVRGLRKFSRDDAGGPLETVVVREVVQETLDVYAQRLMKHGIELRLDIDCAEAARCRPHELSQVLLNLLNNAFHAVEEQSERWIELAIAPVGGAVEVRITDSGPGIPQDLREKVFQPFFTTKPVGKGTGLGLSISKGIVEEFGGRLRLRDELPTQLVIELPLAGSDA